MKLYPFGLVKQFAYCALLLLPYFSFGQNLVANGDFESYDECPSEPSELDKAIPWFNPTNGTPDFFNVCNTFVCSAGVPANRFGDHNEAFSGDGYAGFLGYYESPPAPPGGSREYLSIQLDAPLEDGITYLFRCRIRRTPSCFYASEVGVHLSETSLSATSGPVIELSPNVLETAPITDTSWTTIFATFVGTGVEEYLTIGNFRTDQETTLMSPGNFPDQCNSSFSTAAAYYFVDDISLVSDAKPVSTQAALEENAFKVFPNPAEDYFSVQMDIADKTKGLYLNIYNSLGQLRYSRPAQQQTVVITTSELGAKGIYFVEMVNEAAKRLAIKKVILQ